ncbi:MAG: hypothetical protein GAK34_03454 [Delftia tsuruhatensis]|nr:MAG: hypothetical protein GAK34_03454 [Delftia tsuruhatensis]
MMASSTSRPSARISEPSVMRSKFFPVAAMMMNTAASVSGTAAATTTPTRQPMLAKHTTSTTSSAARNLSMNSSTEALMFTAWSVTLVRPMPSGMSALMAPTSRSSALPRSSPFQPSRMTTPSSKAGSAPLRMMKVEGSS